MSLHGSRNRNQEVTNIYYFHYILNPISSFYRLNGKVLLTIYCIYITNKLIQTKLPPNSQQQLKYNYYTSILSFIVVWSSITLFNLFNYKLFNEKITYSQHIDDIILICINQKKIGKLVLLKDDSTSSPSTPH
jgi:hypothetical protein